MQVTNGTWRMREQCVPGSLFSSPSRAWERGYNQQILDLPKWNYQQTLDLPKWNPQVHSHTHTQKLADFVYPLVQYHSPIFLTIINHPLCSKLELKWGQGMRVLHHYAFNFEFLRSLYSS